MNKVSLVIPVKNEEGSVGALCDSIERQTRLPDEVLFIDAGSTDATLDLIRHRPIGSADVKVISIGSAYPGIARNAGVSSAKNEIIAFTDGGIVLGERWLEELCRAFDESGRCDIVYGNYSPKTDTLFKECLAIAVVAPMASADAGYIRPRFIASSMLRKSVWEAVGGFPDMRAGEDRLFMEKCDKAGFRSVRCPGASVVWDIPSDIPAVFRRFSNYSFHNIKAGRYGDWHIPVLRIYIAATLLSILGVVVSPAFFLALVTLLMARTIKRVAAYSNDSLLNKSHFPAYLLLSTFLITVIDFACLCGAVRFLFDRKAS